MKKKLALLTLYYFRYFARVQLKKNPRAIIIGITGSAGKTSTRLALVKVLSNKGRVKHTVHANSESGIPLNILGPHLTDYSLFDWLKIILLTPVKLLTNWEKFDYYVVEMGIDGPYPPKNMGYLLTVLRPHVAVVLNAGLSHGGAFDSLVEDKDPERRVAKIRYEIAKEKMKLAYAVDPAGFVIINNDQLELRELSKKVKARLITVGKRTTSLVRLTAAGYRYQHADYVINNPFNLEPAFAYTLGFAFAAGLALGIKAEKAVKSLNGYEAPKGRFRILPGIKQSEIIDSSYNASPDTLLASLKYLDTFAVKRRRVAVIGDMRELGSLSKIAHKNLADWLRKYTDECILFGAETGKYTYPVLERAGFPAAHFTSMDKLKSHLVATLPAGSVVLVKGSQNTILLERAVEAILADRKFRTQLARRGAYWDKKRSVVSA